MTTKKLTTPRYGYLSGYEPKSIAEQTNLLRELITGLGQANEKIAEGILHRDAEGWFGIPRWEKVARTYSHATQKVFDLIEQTTNGGFVNYYENELALSQLVQSPKSIKMLQKIGYQQKGNDILVIPAQFGILHRNRSVQRARAVMGPNQCGLGAFAVGIMLLTHPERLMHDDDLRIDCAGDQFASTPPGTKFSNSPVFMFDDGKIEFEAGNMFEAHSLYGSASMFLV